MWRNTSATSPTCLVERWDDRNMRKEKEINECRVLLMKEEDRGKNSKRREEVKEKQLYADRGVPAMCRPQFPPNLG